MKNPKFLKDSMVVFKKLDKVVSQVFLYFSSTCGFILGWIGLGIILLSASGSIPEPFTILLRVFYFLLSFMIGLKLTLFFMKKFIK